MAVVACKNSVISVKTALLLTPTTTGSTKAAAAAAAMAAVAAGCSCQAKQPVVVKDRRSKLASICDRPDTDESNRLCSGLSSTAVEDEPQVAAVASTTRKVTIRVIRLFIPTRISSLQTKQSS